MKQIAKNFNNLIKKTIFKVQNKTNTKFKISTFNKFLITFIGILFFYIFYLLLPLLYDKGWVKDNIETKLLSEFKIDLSSFKDISYRILPAPHYLIKDSKILLNSLKNPESIADVKNFKIFISQKNLFNKEKMTIKNITINEANFFILRSDFKILNNSNNNKFSNKKIEIKKSNIFFKDNLEEIIAIVKINRAILFFEDKELLNLFNLKGNVFTIPFTLEVKNTNDLIKKKEINFKAKSLNLNVFNESVVEQNNQVIGKNIISFLNSTISTQYEVDDKFITFISNSSRINGSKIKYNGELSINPFDLNLNIILNDYKISQLFKRNSIFTELLKSELFFNENITLNTSLIVKSNTKNQIFHKAEIYFTIKNGKINLDNTKFINNDIGLFKLDNSNVFYENNKLVLNTDLLLDVKDSNRLFSFLNTSKKSRKEIRNILINLNYDFLSNEIQFNNIKINNSDMEGQFLNIIDGFKDNSSNNLIKSRRLFNELFDVYDG
tara:strand:+ start:184 stop:1668 length:1485 start_codon:yes stop_codon:yes gene_type:complete